MIKTLVPTRVIALHERLLVVTGGAHGVREYGMIEDVATLGDWFRRNSEPIA
ncbi:MAG TPA: hypothetical protein VGK74_10650 [Symbiobacteriaceae bacterium]|jgi:prophage maintenance system killer protein